MANHKIKGTCVRCGYCCATNPCQISPTLAKILMQKGAKLTPFKEMKPFYRPYVTMDRVCIYLAYPEGLSKKSKCMLMDYAEFKESMVTGDCDMAKDEWKAVNIERFEEDEVGK